LAARGASYFFLDKKVTKKSSQQIGFFAHRPLPCKPGRTTAAIILPRFAPAFPAFLQKLAMPFPALKATIVLPAFTRSLPADGNIHIMGNLNKNALFAPCFCHIYRSFPSLSLRITKKQTLITF
jgi:hypothetical protein